MEILIRVADGLVTNYGTGLQPLDGHKLVEIDAAQTKDYLARLTASGGSGVTFAGGVFTALTPTPAPAPPKNQILLGMSAEMSAWAATNPIGTPQQLAEHMAAWAEANA